jgi:hypothetical protein
MAGGQYVLPLAVGPSPPADPQGRRVRPGRLLHELVSGKKFDAEDILEVVAVEGHGAYMRMHLELYNAGTLPPSGGSQHTLSPIP